MEEEENKMRRALLLDLETTGLDHNKEQPIEVGCILFDLVIGAPVFSYASLIRADSNAAFAINRIDPLLLVDAPEPKQVWPFVMRLASQADIILAHRKEFDHSFCPPELQTVRPWGCTKNEMEWPSQDGRSGHHLVHLALDGLGVAHAHRAMSDVDTMSRILSRVREMGGDLVTMCERTQRPKATFVANVPYEKCQLAKDAGFTWFEAPVKEWRKTMFVDDVAKLPFPVREVKGQVAP
jgi:DNA polymerase III subunit epsilon